MRDYLFHGKRKDNGEWVEGYYTELPIGSLGASIFANDEEIVCEDTASYIIKVFTKQHSNYSNGNPLQVVECEKYEVIPETVGQYTGLTDKNGKKIFDGDIVNFKATAYFFHNCKIEYDIYDGCFRAVDRNAQSSPMCGCFIYEVIGNIHDNPELLKGGV